MARQVTQCPVCDAPLRITELTCVACDTKLHGVFPPSPLARLSRDHQEFMETFLLCRGVIREVERALGISYPTVRARLDAAVTALEAALADDKWQQQSERAVSASVQAGSFVVTATATGAAAAIAAAEAAREERRRDLLRQVEEGLIDPAEAARRLRHL